MKEKIANFFLGLLFPKFCFGCQSEGSYLCEDCRAILEISKFHEQHSGQNLKDLYFALPYRNPLVKNLIRKFKYQPFVKELARPLSFLIIEHFQLLNNKPSFIDFTIIPVPLEKRKLKWRGFNQAEEISKKLSCFLEIPLFSGCLIKTKETIAQVELTGNERKENIKGAFAVKNSQEIKNKKILLVDDVFTTGSTMEEAARILKAAGAKEIVGVVITRASPEEDRF